MGSVNTYQCGEMWISVFCKKNSAMQARFISSIEDFILSNWRWNWRSDMIILIQLKEHVCGPNGPHGWYKMYRTSPSSFSPLLFQLYERNRATQTTGSICYYRSTRLAVDKGAQNIASWPMAFLFSCSLETLTCVLGNEVSKKLMKKYKSLLM